MENLPNYISYVFMVTTLLTVLLFYKATMKSKLALVILSVWFILQGIIGYSGFYTDTDTLPPRILAAVLPPLLIIIWLFTTRKGKIFIDSLDLKILTVLHIVRIPVEIVLYWLYIQGTIPGLMTFEGRNFDILAGLTAPFIYYFGFIKIKLSNGALLAWNFLCLGLLLNIVINAVLSVPFPFQQFAFDQPNIAILHYPFIWLPALVVPLVLLSHLVTIRQLLHAKSKNSHPTI